MFLLFCAYGHIGPKEQNVTFRSQLCYNQGAKRYQGTIMFTPKSPPTANRRAFFALLRLSVGARRQLLRLSANRLASDQLV